MAYAYHDDRTKYFEHQRRVTAEYVIPFIEESGVLAPGSRVLEIGCGEAGVLKAFIDRGATAVGVDRNGDRLGRGRGFLADDMASGRLTLLHQDAHELGNDDRFKSSFDLIVMKDVIEHIDDRPALFAMMRKLLSPTGRVFLAFPPWRMPFGGHQQICRSRVLSHLPYFHLLPQKAYKQILEGFGETPRRIASLLDTKRTGIGISEFDDLVAQSNYRTLSRRIYLLNPVYSYRFGLSPLTQLGAIARSPRIRDFVSTCAYFTTAPSRE